MNEPIQNPSFHASKVPPRLMAEAYLLPKQYGIHAGWYQICHFGKDCITFILFLTLCFMTEFFTHEYYYESICEGETNHGSNDEPFFLKKDY